MHHTPEDSGNYLSVNKKGKSSWDGAGRAERKHGEKTTLDA